MDKAGTVAFHRDFFAAFVDTKVDLLELIENGDKLSARLLISGRHEGEFMGVPPTGNNVQLAITTILTMRDGKCIERWSTADMFGLMIQIGAVPPPGG
jgi:predicted ester cyclase